MRECPQIDGRAAVFGRTKIVFHPVTSDKLEVQKLS